MGEFVKSLVGPSLTYHGTQLPRIPVLVQREITKQLIAAEQEFKAASRHASIYVAGAKVMGKFSEDGVWYEAVIDEVTTNGYKVTYTEYGNTEVVQLTELKPLGGGDRGGSGKALVVD